MCEESYCIITLIEGEEWCKKGTNIPHRLDGPAIEYANGDKLWYKEGKCHREDGPAIEYANGEKRWFLEGKRHREDGPAIEYANGSKYWYKEGKLHREDGPAVECANGDKEWYKEGKLHRENGPAIEWSSSVEYYLDGKFFPTKELWENELLSFEEKIIKNLLD